MPFSDVVLIIQLIATIVQITVIIWIARQWRNQKKEERYSDQCHLILKSWPTINGYWKIVTGQGIYHTSNQRHHLDKFFNENEGIISKLHSFLSYPEIYIYSKDKESIKKIKAMGNDYNNVLDAFHRWGELNEQTTKSMSLRAHLETEYYPSRWIDGEDHNEIESIKNNNDNDSVKKTSCLFSAFKKI